MHEPTQSPNYTSYIFVPRSTKDPRRAKRELRKKLLSDVPRKRITLWNITFSQKKTFARRKIVEKFILIFVTLLAHWEILICFLLFFLHFLIDLWRTFPSLLLRVAKSSKNFWWGRKIQIVWRIKWKNVQFGIAT